ncbi:hypothetical protein K4Q31_06220 [Staphylococcus epidermidis]|uniref:hypothetical protein n=1 Tax=Staphylococcus epidermidis TaxID=1282 RepID=UPI000385916F|nr:hypothetical protein [Staphylococcus epidermidis]AJP25804.1 hypothetical protein UC17_10675 [Staphylococcus epidermidis]EPZ40827.1 hypothetical protein HMPREF1157_1331 [Staphylococcus epidermidis E13A]MCG2253617.1 hypothetical protein [Staphylococcus epidermidis]MCG2303772.1 hypothetical protein [Staphylococcus epidermidis]
MYELEPMQIPEINMFNEELDKELQEFYYEKQMKNDEKIARDIERNQYLKTIAENTDLIVSQTLNIVKYLQTIDSLLSKQNITLSEVNINQSELKNINADIYSELVKVRIGTEEDRLNATRTLTERIGDVTSIASDLFTIIQMLIGKF